MEIPPTSAELQILQNLPFFAVNITQKDRQRRQARFCSLWNDKAGWKYAVTAYMQHSKKDNKLYVSLVLKAFVVDPVSY